MRMYAQKARTVNVCQQQLEVTAGSAIRLSCRFADSQGVDSDPTIVRCLLLKPGAVMPEVFIYGSDLVLERDSVGRYGMLVSPNVDESGQWAYRFEGLGSIQAADEAYFTVNPSAFAGV